MLVAKIQVVQRRNIHPYQRYCPHCDQIVSYKHTRHIKDFITIEHLELRLENMMSQKKMICTLLVIMKIMKSNMRCEDDSPPCSGSNSE